MNKTVRYLNNNLMLMLMVMGGLAQEANAQVLLGGLTDTTNINIQIEPIAELQFVNTPLLYLQIPPESSTLPNSGVKFKIRGNAMATLEAKPDEFINIGGEWMGKADRPAGGSLGYRLLLKFPSSPPVQSASLPGTNNTGTRPILHVNMATNGGMVNGELHMEASESWSQTGLPLPGIYEGSVIITLTAES